MAKAAPQVSALHAAVKRGDLPAMRQLLENDAIALGWAAFFGRPDVVEVLINASSELSQRNKHGLTPLGCAIGGAQGRWRQFSSASIEDWQRAADLLRKRGAVE